MKAEEENWDLIITSDSQRFFPKINAVWKYKDLLFLLVRRDFVSTYKQTLLGSLWYFISPLITTVLFSLVFGTLAKISTEGIPPLVFYMSGLIPWTFFSDSLNKTSQTFTGNAALFGKVYFPRIIVPIAAIFSNGVKLGAQFFLFLLFWSFYYFNINSFTPVWNKIWAFPLLIALMGLMGMGMGLIISSMNVRYRDINFLVSVMVQLLMYASPIIYPVSALPEKYRIFILLNPVSPLIEAFKYVFLGIGFFSWSSLAYSLCITILVLLAGLFVFTRIEKNFVDTV